LSNTGLYSGTGSAALTLTNVPASYHGYRYRVVIGGSCSPSVTSTSAGLTVQVAPVITQGPLSAIACEDGTTRFTVVATGSGLSYQWRVNGSNATGGSYTGALTDVLSLNAVPRSLQGARFDVIVQGACQTSAASTIATLTVQPRTEIVRQPQDSRICEGNGASFTVDAGLTVSPTYQWQMSANGATFVAVPANAIYSGVQTATLQVSAPPASNNNLRYRVVVTGACGPPVTSSVARLQVDEAARVLIQPADVEICERDAAAMTAQVSAGGADTYQWQVSADQGTTFRDLSDGNVYSGARRSALEVSSATADLDGYRYRLLINRSGCSQTLSAVATLRVHVRPQADAGPDRVVTRGTVATLDGKATGDGDLQVQWLPFDFLSDPAILNPAVAPASSVQYTLLVTDAHGCSATDDVTVVVNIPFVIPTAFSPNRDGINDAWNIEGIENYPALTVEVINRYGQPVFVSPSGYPEAWDGRYNGSELPWGTYYYKVDLHNGEKPLTGWVELLR